MHHQAMTSATADVSSIVSTKHGGSSWMENQSLSAAERPLNAEGGLDKGQEVNSPSRTFVFPTSPSAARRARGLFHSQPAGPSTLLTHTHTSASPLCLHTRGRQPLCRRAGGVFPPGRMQNASTFVPNLQLRGPPNDLLNSL